MSQLLTAQYRDTLDAEAARLGLPPWDGIPPGCWLEGQMFQESKGDCQARHYDKPVDPDGVDGGPFEDWASYGLFQIEGRTFRGLMGLPADLRFNFSVLYRPLFNIACGLKVLTDNFASIASSSLGASDVPRVLAIYNGGWRGGVRGADTKLVDQAYADLVHSKTALVMKDRGL